MDLTTSPDKPLAVVTGASSGIGYELTKQFAQHGFDLVIASENPAIVETAQVCTGLGANVVSVIIDLENRDALEKFAASITATGRPVEAMALNISDGDLNATSSLQLTKLIMKDMVYRKKGRILFSSEVVEGKADLLQAVCEEIGLELKDTGVTVTSIRKKGNAGLLAQQGFEAMMAGLDYVIDVGFMNHFETEESTADALRRYSEPVRLKH